MFLISKLDHLLESIEKRRFLRLLCASTFELFLVFFGVFLANQAADRLSDRAEFAAVTQNLNYLKEEVTQNNGRAIQLAQQLKIEEQRITQVIASIKANPQATHSVQSPPFEKLTNGAWQYAITAPGVHRIWPGFFSELSAFYLELTDMNDHFSSMRRKYGLMTLPEAERLLADIREAQLLLTFFMRDCAKATSHLHSGYGLTAPGSRK